MSNYGSSVHKYFICTKIQKKIVYLGYSLGGSDEVWKSKLGHEQVLQHSEEIEMGQRLLHGGILHNNNNNNNNKMTNNAT